MKNALTFDEVEKLIKICAKSGVTSLKLGQISVEFGGQTKAFLTKPPTAKQAPLAEKKVETEALEIASRKLDEDEIDELQLTNPSLYEQLLIEGQLTDGKEI